MTHRTETILFKIKSSKFIERLGTFANDNKGSSLIEFAMVTPLLLMLFFAAVELSYFNLHDRRAQQTVDYMADFLSRDENSILSGSEIVSYLDIWPVVNPTSVINSKHLGDTGRGNFGQAYTSVDFVLEDPGCTGLDCEFELDVQFSWSFRWGVQTNPRRSCTQNIVANTAPQDRTTIAEGHLGRGAIIIADVVYKHTPIFGSITPFLSLNLIPNAEREFTSTRHLRGGRALTTPLRSNITQC